MYEVPYVYLLCYATYSSVRHWDNKYTGSGPHVGPKYGQFYEIASKSAYFNGNWGQLHKNQDWICCD